MHAVLSQSEWSLAKKNNVYRNENQDEKFVIRLMMMRGGGREGDGRPQVSWLGRIRAVWDRSDLTQPSFSRTGHVRLDLSHTTDIIPLSGETTAHHHSTEDTGERGVREGGDGVGKSKKQKVRKLYVNRRGRGDLLGRVGQRGGEKTQ